MKFIGTFIILIIISIFFGIRENERRENLYTQFALNKKIQCNDLVVRRSRGWYIKDNTYFTNKKVLRAIIYCKVLE